MLYIDYDKSVEKHIGDFGFVLLDVVGMYNNEDFKVTLSSSPTRKNGEARCLKGNLTELEIGEVLKKFDSNKVNRTYVGV